MPEAPEAVQVGRYKLDVELGRGSSAVVYRSQDPLDQHAVAVKLLPGGLLLDPTFEEYFRKMAGRIARLEHPALVQLDDYGNDDNQLYLVSRLMPGGSLRHKLKQGPLASTEAVQLATRLAGALDLIHQQGLIHGSLHPNNILFNEQGEAALSDIGIFSLLQRGSSTSGSISIGAPAYFSPEQVLGVTLDHRTDIYSLGVILFELLAGRPPYSLDGPAVLIARQHVVEPVPRLLNVRPDLPPASEAVLARALAKKPAVRFESAGQLAAALAAAFDPSRVPLAIQPPPVTGGPGQPAELPPVTVTANSSSRQFIAIGLIVLAGITALALLYWLFLAP